MPSLPDPGILGGAEFAQTATFFCGGQQHPLPAGADLGQCWRRMPLGSRPEMLTTIFPRRGTPREPPLWPSNSSGRAQPVGGIAGAIQLRKMPGARGVCWGRGDAPPVPAAVLSVLAPGGWRDSAPTAATPPPAEGPPTSPLPAEDLLCTATPKPSPWESKLTVPLTRREKNCSRFRFRTQSFRRVQLL